MLLATVKRLTSGPRPIALLFLLLLASIYLMSGATQNSAVFGRLYSLLLVVNILALVLLVALILRHLVQLVVQYRQRAPGSRLTVRLVVMFVVLAVAPVSLVYYFAVQFLHRGIDSWFDVRVETALNDALEMGRTALDGRVRELLRRSRAQAGELITLTEPAITLRINELREQSGAIELTLLTFEGRVIASSSTDPAEIVPNLPNSAILLQLRQGLSYAAIEPIRDDGLNVRIAIGANRNNPSAERWVLHALYPVPNRIGALADSIQAAFADYQELTFLRQPLKYSFTLTLSLVLLLSLLTAVWAAFFAARRLVAPVSDLVEGTRAVAAGDYDKRLPLPGRDELGFLVRSFNEMTRKIALARDEAQRSQQQAEEQRAYLETVLGHLSSGVLTIDDDHVLRTTNATAGQILGIELAPFLGQPLTDISARYPNLAPLVEVLLPQLGATSGDWRGDVVLFGPGGRQVLMCRGSALPRTGELHEGGHVIVFDDVTALVQGQRDAAWAEVARRMAHEIKNPLTPIQLSAERLRHKYLKTMPAEDAELLDRSTHTIVQQVEAMKEMVKTFSEYAHSRRLEPKPLDLNTVIREVAELYLADKKVRLRMDLDAELPAVEADAGRLRQVLHNLIKNAIEAGGQETDTPVQVDVSTACVQTESCRFVELKLTDNGPGIPEALRGRLFEPYVTTKPKGSGLGLAIVKKIVEEHGGLLTIENMPAGGAQVTVRLPVTQTRFVPLAAESSS